MLILHIILIDVEFLKEIININVYDMSILGYFVNDIELHLLDLVVDLLYLVVDLLDLILDLLELDRSRGGSSTMDQQQLLDLLKQVEPLQVRHLAEATVSNRKA